MGPQGPQGKNGELGEQGPGGEKGAEGAEVRDEIDCYNFKVFCFQRNYSRRSMLQKRK